MRPAIATTILLAWLVIRASAVQEAPTASAPAGLLDGVRCASQIHAALDAWAADLARAIAEPPDPEGTNRWRMPSATLGVWVRLRVEPSGAPILERISAARVDFRTYAPDCRPLDESRSAASPLAEGFTDQALADLLESRGAGLILVWSPHMPLSVDEYAELEDVAAALGLRLVPVLDPLADQDYARRVARERRLPDRALTRLASIELAFRGMTTHAPSVQAFADGKLVGPVLSGYRDRNTARLALERLLAPR